MEEDNYSQQELFEQRKYISDLIEEKTEKKKSCLLYTSPSPRDDELSRMPSSA